jgi:hypothetical protein
MEAMGVALILAAAALAAGPQSPIQRRCGWLDNPTPANWWLTDSQGEWILSVQGGYQAPGMDDMPDMSTGGWVETNGYYGFRCACLDVTVDAGEHKIMRLVKTIAKPLRQCRADPKLPRR